MEDGELASPEGLPEEGEERVSIWKAILIALAIGLVLLIALGILRYWMVNYYGGW